MPPLKNSRYEIYTQNWFKGETRERSALIAGFSPKWTRSIGSRLSTRVDILARYNELQQKAEDALIAGVIERKQILTEIARAKLTDYISCGPDGDQINIGPESPNSRAFQEITSHTEFNEETAMGAVITKLKLHSPTQAIDLLNKMEKIYSDGIIIDNRKQVINFDVRNLTDDQLEAIIAKYGNIGIPQEASSP